MPSKELTTIDFHGAKLIALRGDAPETTLVAMKPMVDGMGLDWEMQRQRIARHPVLGSAPIKRQAQMPWDDQVREHVFLPLNRVNFWLATINPKLVSAEVRPKIIEYQTECADVLYQHFFAKATGMNAELSERDLHRLGGIIKSVVRRQQAEELAPLKQQVAALAADMRTVMDGFDPTQSVVRDYKPALQVLIDHSVPQKGRKPLVDSCSGRLRKYCLATERGNAMRISRESGRYLFHKDVIDLWLAAEGTQLIAAHKAKIVGQGVLPFRKAGKGEAR